MLVYNANNFVGKAIQSILNQSYTNLELIIINDGSTDGSMDVINSFNDDRIKLHCNKNNRGIVYCRNKGLKLAKGEYIGMFDADDIAYPKKFEKQIAFLEQNSDYGMVGSWVKQIDEKGKQLPKSWKLRASSKMIPSIMLFRNYFLQSAVLYRKDCISKFSFSEGFDVVEDYLIWIEIIKEYKTSNLNDYLVNYRIHNNGVTQKQSDKKLDGDKKIIKIQLSELKITPTENELNLHILTRNNTPIGDIKTLKSVEKWLLKIISKNDTLNVYDDKMLSQIIINRWFKVCLKVSGNNFKVLYYLFSSKVIRNFIVNKGSVIKSFRL